MKNQYSFRLTTTLLPTDTTAKVTQVINKVDSEGNKFYPTFTEETVVITNDDRTIMETTRAVCTNGAITFTKRWLPDDGSLEPVENRKLTRNPWSLLFITLWASDIIDKDDDMVWQWDQTYQWKATYKWRLITEKGVEYPHFDSLEDLQAYWTPFGWMFAVVDSDWELYRYNAETEEWNLITTSTPAQPAKASKTAIWTVRVATDEEFNNWTDTWENWEYLMPTPSQVKGIAPVMDLHVVDINQGSSDIRNKWSRASITYEIPRAWFVVIKWQEYYISWKELNTAWVSSTGWPCVYSWDYFSDLDSWYPSWTLKTARRDLYAVPAWTLTVTCLVYDESAFPSMPENTNVRLDKFFYFW